MAVKKTKETAKPKKPSLLGSITGSYAGTSTSRKPGSSVTTRSTTTTTTKPNTTTTTTSKPSIGTSYSTGSSGTTINGKTYGTGYGGYQSDINRAVANKDYVLAAQLEAARNNKIDTTGSTQSKTNLYSGWLPGSTDYSTIGRNQMDSGASWQEVLDTYNARANKAANTVGMEKFVNDEKQQEMLNYILANMNAEQEIPEFDASYFDETRPTYTSQYDSRIDDLLNQILNRDDFSYDASTDPLFQQYQAMYQREGNRAMNDALASAAANAGGMNSYAITAAQQANDYYTGQIGDKIPELYQLAYQMYLQDIDNDVQNLGLLNDMDTTQYNRYRDTMSDWYNDRNFAYNQYRDDMSDSQWLKQFNYDSLRDNISDQRYDQEWAYNVGRDQIADQRYNTEWEYNTNQDRKNYAYNKAWTLIEQGVMPDTATLEAAGITAAEASAYIASVKSAAAAKSSGGGSGGGGGNGRSTGGAGYDNGSLTSAQVKQLQNYYGVTADGMWGSNSTSAAGGLSADEAWNKVYGSGKPTGGNGYVSVADLNAESNGSGVKPVGYLSAKGKQIQSSLDSMSGQLSAKESIPNTIIMYVNEGSITPNEGATLLEHFGYDPDDYLN